MRLWVLDPRQRLSSLVDSLKSAAPSLVVDCHGQLEAATSGAGEDTVFIVENSASGELSPTLAKLFEAVPSAPVLLLCQHEHWEACLPALHLGVQDCLRLEDLTGEQLLTASRLALARETRERTLETEWHHAEDAVRQSEARYRRLLDSVTDYVYTVEIRDGEAVGTSHGPGCLAVTGYPAEAFRSDPMLWHRIIHPDDRDMVVQTFQTLMQTGEPIAIEHRLVRPDGAIRWVRNKQVPRRAATGDVVAYDGLISDITERKAVQDDLLATNTRLKSVLEDLTRSHEELKMAQQQLIQAEKFQAVGQLAAGVAHEVKNPLAILQMGIEYFSEYLPSAEEAPSVLREMRKAVSDASSVISDLVQASAGRDGNVHTVELHVVVQQALRITRPALGKSGVRLVTHLEAPGAICRVDPGKLTHSLVQILMNACDATPEGGTVTVQTTARTLGSGETGFNQGDRSGRVFRQGDRVLVVEITDTGVGIPADKLSRVFDPFYTTKRTGKGKGLGLSVAKGIINQYAGEMTIVSAEGRGSTVTIMLPNGAPNSKLGQP